MARIKNAEIKCCEINTVNCKCTCHNPIYSNAYCEHCKGNNSVGNYWREKMTYSSFDAYFLNKSVLIGWERIVIPKGDRIFKILSLFQLYNETYIIIKPIEEQKEIMIKLCEIKSITLA